MALIIWSLLVITVSLTLCQILRFFIRRLVKEKTFQLFDEFLAAFQTSVCILEVGVIAGVYGSGSWVSLITIFLFGVVKHSAYIRGKYVANPVCFIDSFYNAGKNCPHSPFFIAYVIIAQILAAVLAHPFARVLWGRTYSEFHHSILFTDCKATLEVPFFHGFAVEIFTTFVAWSTDYFTPMKVKPPIRSAVSLALATFFSGTSGTWMNPAVASAHTFSCKGHDNAWEHVITYWLGPFIAVILFYEIKELCHTARDKYRNEAISKRMEEKHDTNGFANGKRMHTESSGRIIPEEITANNFEDKKSKKYHRSPGGSLRPRLRPNIGPG